MTPPLATLKPVKEWWNGDRLNGMFRGYGKMAGRSHFGRKTIRVVEDEALWPSPDQWPNTTAPAPPALPYPEAGGPDVYAGKDPLEAAREFTQRGNGHTPPFTPQRPVHYISNGDCGGRWNPGHCHADLLAAELVLRMIGAKRSSTRVVLQSGHNYHGDNERKHGPHPWDQIDR